MAVSLGPSGLILDNTTVPNETSDAVIQIVQAINTTDTRVTSSIDFITASITPSSTSSKILIMGTFAAVARRNGSSSEGFWRLFKNSSQLYVVDGITPWNDGAGNNRSMGSISFNYLDNPSTTSSTTYKMVVECSVNGVEYK